jgi:lipoate-protein ligase B
MDLGVGAYREVLALQETLVARRHKGEIPDTLILVEHPPVYTLGRSGNDSNILAKPEDLKQRGIEVIRIGRGGDVTFHGPGQLVGYPIFNLSAHKQDLHWYLRQLEEVLIVALEEFGIGAERNPGLTGVWTEGRKIASIGVHAKQWVTWHGFALNVTTELSAFDLIVPCGIPGVVMTSVAAEAQRTGVPDCRRTGVPAHRRTDEGSAERDLGAAVREAVVRAFERVFGFAAVERLAQIP